MNMEDDFWGRSTVAIIGLGLMGGSLAMAMHERCKKLVGYDQDKAVVNRAMERGLIDNACSLTENGLSDADMIILAVPVMSIIEILEKIPRLNPNPAIILDLGSTKRRVVEKMNLLPPRFDAVGGHPMCGKEKAGLNHADKTLFKKTTFVFTETEQTGKASREILMSLAAMIGAVPFWMDADQHDSWVASTSHIPFLVANSLTNITLEEASPLISSGFSSTSRLASSSLKMMMDIIKTNRDNILTGTIRFREQFDRIIDLLEQENDADLEKVLIRGAAKRQRILTAKKARIET